MFGRNKKRITAPLVTRDAEQLSPVHSAHAKSPSRRHGRRGIRSSVTGPDLRDPASRTSRFESDARAAVQFLQQHLTTELAGVHIGFATAPLGGSTNESTQPMYYSVNRKNRTIIMYRMPIQRYRGLHVDDADHRRFFVEHCVHRAVCEYLDQNPWDILPGRFEHY